MVSGYYGCGNVGDEAVLAGILEAFRRRSGDETEVVALSQNPEATTRLHGIRSAYRMSPSIVRETLKGSQLLLSGGGSLLQDTTSFKSLIYYLWVVRVAQQLKVPVMFYAQGIGPFRRPISKALVRLIANRVNAITVRDEPSLALLKKIGVNRPPIEVTADPAFALPLSSPEIANKLWAREELPFNDRLKIGAALRPWGQESSAVISRYARLLTEIEAQTGAQVILIPMQIPGDLIFSEKAASETGRSESFPILGRELPPGELLHLVGKMNAVVAMRLHTLIFAARAAVPPFALSYDPKVDSLMSLLNLSDSQAHWRDFDPSEIAVKIKIILENRLEFSKQLQEKATELEIKALRNAEIALSLISSKREKA